MCVILSCQILTKLFGFVNMILVSKHALIIIQQLKINFELGHSCNCDLTLQLTVPIHVPSTLAA